jgi:hypothetical protein
MHDSADSSGGRPAKLTLDADIPAAKWPQPLSEWVFFVQTRFLQGREKSFATRPHALDSRVIDGKVQVFLTRFNNA